MLSGVVGIFVFVFVIVFVLMLVLVLMLTLIRCVFIDCIELPLYDLELRLLLLLLLLLLLFLLPFLFVPLCGPLFVLLPLDATDGDGDTDFLLLAWFDDLLFVYLFFTSFCMRRMGSKTAAL